MCCLDFFMSQDYNRNSYRISGKATDGMSEMKTILIVEKHKSDREILYHFLRDEYQIMVSENYETAQRTLERFGQQIDCVIMNMSIPPKSGYEFLAYMHTTPGLTNIPLVVSCGLDEAEYEQEALRLGAWDYILKPYKKEILKYRLEHAMERSQLTAFQQLKFLAEYDALTKIYNKNKFLEVTEEMLLENSEKQYALIRFDINRFQLVNSFYGTKEGDRILKYIAVKLHEYAVMQKETTYGRVDSDVFALCTPYETEETIKDLVNYVKTQLREAEKDFDLVPSFGIYLIQDYHEEAVSMLNKAGLAAKQIKGSYVNNYAFYSRDLSDALEQEQLITNAMSDALEQGEFQVYLQPKYSLRSGKPEGAEALVRWVQPGGEVISPGVFIPVFEKNGFITKMDYHVWEQVCILLRKWIDQGKRPYPISVNVSRVNIYNSDFVEKISELTQRYHVPNHLLHLELTESAYTDNLEMIKNTVRCLQKRGFVILMDDFGSAYSSLNVLKDIEVDVLKIDMKFLENTSFPERGQNILSSVVRMSKWLQIPIIAEGVEVHEQVEFLKEIGCEYVQGYYFAKPMLVQEYEALVGEEMDYRKDKVQMQRIESVHSPQIQGELLFSNVMQALAIYSYNVNGTIEILRVNRAYYELVGENDGGIHKRDLLIVVKDEYKQTILDTFERAIRSESYAQCEYVRDTGDGRSLWIRLQLQYMGGQDRDHILFGTLSDITIQKEMDEELVRYRGKRSYEDDGRTMLIVNDNEMQRLFLTTIFENRFQICQAENGAKALEMLESEDRCFDIILLDIDMPKMDGLTFLEKKGKNRKITMVPVVVITENDNPNQQIKALKLGAADYIVRPFIKEIIRRRVENIYECNEHFQEIMQEYRSVVKKGRQDSLTGVYNRSGIEKMVDRVLKNKTEQKHALLMVDVDEFKSINDTHGHVMGDNALAHVTKHLRQCFRKEDVIGRFGGDEFVVCMQNVPSQEAVKQKCLDLCRSVENQEDDFSIQLTLSIGAALSNEDDDFSKLYERADIALYESKRRGKNQATLFEELTLEK